MALITWGCENVSCQALGVWGLCAEWEEGKVSFLQDENQVSPFSQDHSRRPWGNPPHPDPLTFQTKDSQGHPVE